MYRMHCNCNSVISLQNQSLHSMHCSILQYWISIPVSVNSQLWTNYCKCKSKFKSRKVVCNFESDFVQCAVMFMIVFFIAIEYWSWSAVANLLQATCLLFSAQSIVAAAVCINCIWKYSSSSYIWKWQQPEQWQWACAICASYEEIQVSVRRFAHSYQCYIILVIRHHSNCWKGYQKLLWLCFKADRHQEWVWAVILEWQPHYACQPYWVGRGFIVCTSLAGLFWKSLFFVWGTDSLAA